VSPSLRDPTWTEATIHISGGDDPRIPGCPTPSFFPGEFQSTYEVAADLAGWDRSALEDPYPNQYVPRAETRRVFD
jgi:hypothetical protein